MCVSTSASRSLYTNEGLQADYLYTADIKALSHIIHKTSHYHKPGFARFRIAEVIGNGAHLVTETE